MISFTRPRTILQLKRWLVLASALSVLSSASYADTLGSWVIPSSGTATTISSSNNLTGVTVGAMGSTATGASSTSNGFGGAGFSTSATVSASASKNFNFAVSASAGYDVVIDGVSNFRAYSSASGPGTWTLFYSTNSSFATSTQIAQVTGATNSIQDMTALITAALAGSPITVKSGTSVYFRLVGTSAVTTTGSGRVPVGTVSLLGSVSIAPIANMVWSGGSVGNWNYDATNVVWLDGATAVSFVSGSIANINSAAYLIIDPAGVAAGAVTNNIASGTTTLTNGSITSGSIVNAGAGSLSIQGTNTATASTLVNSGSGTIELLAPGSFTTVNIPNGTIRALKSGALSGAVNISSGGQLDVTTVSNSIGILTVTNGSVAGSGIVTATGSSFGIEDSNRVVDASIRGTGNLTKTGSRTLTLTGSNAFSGDVNLTGGALMTSGNDRLPDTAVINLGTNTLFRLGGNETIKAISASASATAKVDLQNYALTLNVTASNSYASSIIGAGGSLVKDGASVLTLNETNTFTGGTTVRAGSLRLQASGNRTTDTNTGITTLVCSPFGTGTLTLQGGRIFSSSVTSTNLQQRYIYNGIAITGDFALGGGGSHTNADIIVSTSVTGSFSTLIADATITADNTVEWYQPISGEGFSFSKAGLSPMQLRGTNALGTLTVKQGALYIRNTNAISSVTVAEGATLGFGSSNVFSPLYLGNALIVLSNNATLAQYTKCGTGSVGERTIPNSMVLKGSVSFGGFDYGNYFAGNIDLGGATDRSIYLSNSATITGVISNGGLVINDTVQSTNNSRTLTVASASTFTGPTLVAGGATNITIVTTNTNTVPPTIETNTLPATFGPILLVTGSLASSNVTVQSNATLAGTGSVANVTVQAGGELAPGNASAAPIAIAGSLSMESGSTATMAIDSLADYDRVTSSSASVLNGTVNVTFTTNFAPAAASFQLFSGAVSGSPTLVVPPLTNASLVWVTNDFATTGAISISNTQSAATPYGNWLTNYPSLSGAATNGTSDPDGDSYDNNTEFAFDGNPTVGTPAFMTASNNAGLITVSFVALRTNTSAYSVLSTTNLATGPWSVDNSVTVTNASDQAGVLLTNDYVRRSFTAPTNSATFFRVRASVAN